MIRGRGRRRFVQQSPRRQDFFDFQIDRLAARPDFADAARAGRRGAQDGGVDQPHH
jgi:hypothetical protein